MNTLSSPNHCWLNLTRRASGGGAPRAVAACRRGPPQPRAARQTGGGGAAPVIVSPFRAAAAAALMWGRKEKGERERESPGLSPPPPVHHLSPGFLPATRPVTFYNRKPTTPVALLPFPAQHRLLSRSARPSALLPPPFFNRSLCSFSGLPQRRGNKVFLSFHPPSSPHLSLLATLFPSPWTRIDCH